MKVYLVGAGPGDPGLITVKAAELLKRADVVVYDYLANPAFLDLCRKDAEIIYVGKKGGDHTLRQEGINELLVRKARGGGVVVRLKGGDPYIFGRGGEEAEELVEAGIDFEVVPGITAAAAGTCYAGIPLTHRNYASSVTFITGNEGEHKEESVLDWDALARSASTLVFYMGMRNLPYIAKNLIESGLSPDTPAAVIQWGTRCNQRSVTATLDSIADTARLKGLSSPALIVVGEVIRLRDTLNWFERKPLLGKGVVVTRAREQASSLKGMLEEMGACCLQFPTIRITPLGDYSEVDAAIDSLGGYDWCVFTSVNGVIHFFDRLEAKGLDSRTLAPVKIAAIGPATAERLAEEGIRADFVPPRYVAESVVQGMLERGAGGARVLIPRARVAREVLPEELAKAGAEVTILPVYETVPAGESAEEFHAMLEDGRIHCITFGSSSTVDNFFSVVQADMIRKHRDRIKLASIGPVTAKTLEGYGFTADIQPDDFTIPALAEAVARELAG